MELKYRAIKAKSIDQNLSSRRRPGSMDRMRLKGQFFETNGRMDPGLRRDNDKKISMNILTNILDRLVDQLVAGSFV